MVLRGIREGNIDFGKRYICVELVQGKRWKQASGVWKIHSRFGLEITIVYYDECMSLHDKPWASVYVIQFRFAFLLSNDPNPPCLLNPYTNPEPLLPNGVLLNYLPQLFSSRLLFFSCVSGPWLACLSDSVLHSSRRGGALVH